MSQFYVTLPNHASMDIYPPIIENQEFLLQKGGFIGALLAPLLSFRDGILSNAYKN